MRPTTRPDAPLGRVHALWAAALVVTVVAAAASASAAGPPREPRPKFVAEFADLCLGNDAEALIKIDQLTKDSFRVRKLSLFDFREPVERLPAHEAHAAIVRTLVGVARAAMVRGRVGRERDYFKHLYKTHIGKVCAQKVGPLLRRHKSHIETMLKADKTDASSPEMQLKRLGHFCDLYANESEMNLYAMYRKFSKALKTATK